MSKVIRFRGKVDNVLEFLDEVKEEVEDLDIDNMMIACKLHDGSVLTGYTNNLDYGVKMELLGHVNSDIIKQMIEENYLQ